MAEIARKTEMTSFGAARDDGKSEFPARPSFNFPSPLFVFARARKRIPVDERA